MGNSVTYQDYSPTKHTVMLAKCILDSSGSPVSYIIINLDKIAAFQQGGDVDHTKITMDNTVGDIEIEFTFDKFTERLIKYKMGNITPADFEVDDNERVMPKLMKFYDTP